MSIDNNPRNVKITATARLSFYDLREQYEIAPDTGELVKRPSFDDPLPQSKFSACNASICEKSNTNLVNVQGLGEGCAFPKARVVYFLATGVDPASAWDHALIHLDGNVLNDRLDNLELVASKLHEQKVESLPKPGKTGFRNVQYDATRPNQPYRVRVRVAEKLRELGRYETRDEAIEAIVRFEEANGIVKKRRGYELAAYNRVKSQMESQPQSESQSEK